MNRALPAPTIGWEPVYELLRCLGEATDDETVRASECVSLITGMQAGEPIDEWLLRELLALALLDVEDPETLDAVGPALGLLQGAGILHVEWESDSELRRAATHDADLYLGRRNGAAYASRVRGRMRRIEDGLRRALEAVEAFEDDDGR